MKILHRLWSSLRWLNGHIIQILAWLALPLLMFELVRSFLDPASNPTHQLVLIGLVFVAAILAQSANELLRRLTKVGPIELVAQREEAEKLFEAFDAEFEELALVSADADPELWTLSETLLWEYEKADLFVTLLQWAGLKKDKVESEKLQHLLFRMSVIDFRLEKYVRAADRLELLLRISDAKFLPAETHYRCGRAYKFGAKNSQGSERSSYLLKARDHLRHSIKEDPHHWMAFFELAYVQVDMKMCELARQNNKKAIEIRPDFATAKYNLAVCHVMCRDLKAALATLKEIQPDDMGVPGMKAEALKDPELKPLLEDLELGQEAKRVLQSLDNQRS